MSSLALPLSGFRVLSAEQYGAGPCGTMHLAQLGADVLKTRIWALEEFFRHIRRHDDVWVTTRKAIADRFMAKFQA
ncbi:MAG: CoA transferase [Pacificimonas sp.]|jgi:crotonobetainyl-CoA:carnitine CoA-transferase CaiB-like acyl-CoA transferase|nr:CoA transferase [Pacificimonas sp.]